MFVRFLLDEFSLLSEQFTGLYPQLVTRGGELPSTANTAGMRAKRALRISVFPNVFLLLGS